VLHERVADIVDIDEAGRRRHPGVGIRPPAIGSFADPDRLDAARHHHPRHVPQIVEKLFEPELEVEPVPQDQVRALRLHEVARRRLVIVDFGAGLGDRLHRRRVSGYVARHVGDDGEGRHHLELAILLPGAAWQRQHEQPAYAGQEHAPAARRVL
jgi:hypothetical protein